MPPVFANSAIDRRRSVRPQPARLLSTRGRSLFGAALLASLFFSPAALAEDDEGDNLPPRVANPIENQVIEEDRPFTLDVSRNFRDPDGDSLFFFADGLPGSLTLSGDGLITGTPTQEEIGRYQVRVIAFDPSSAFASDRFRIQIVGVNDPPTIVRQRENPLPSREDERLRVRVNDFDITDPDSPLDAVSIRLQPGANYSLTAQDELLPAPDYFGPLTVPVIATDGLADSEVFQLRVRIDPVNDAPRVVTPIADRTVDEDVPVQFNVAGNFTDVEGERLTFTALGLPPALSISDSGVISGTPRQPDVGRRDVTVTARDPGGLTANARFSLTVRNINDPPVITGQRELGIDEDQSLTVTVGDLLIQDPDNGPADMTLRLTPGRNYTLAGTTVRPDANFFGTLTVPAVVNDGQADSNTFELRITVRSVNDRPQITGQTELRIDEDTELRFRPGLISVTDPDNTYPDDFTFTLGSGPDHTVVAGERIRPRADFSGTLEVPVTVNDGRIDSAPFALQIQVRPINDAPVITGQRRIEMDEDDRRTITAADLIIDDPDDPAASLTLRLSPGSNYRLEGATVIPAGNFNGTLNVPVTVSDGEADSNVFGLEVIVRSVNDIPVIQSQRPLATEEDTPLPLSLGDLTVTDPDHRYPEDFRLIVQSGDNYTVQGTTVVPAPDFDGELAVPVRVNDGIDRSAPFVLTISVSAVNDAPAIVGQAPLAIDEDSSLVLTIDSLVVEDPDDPPSALRLTLEPGENYTLQGNTVRPAEDYFGALNVPATVADGVATSEPFLVAIEVRAVNDAPVITGQLPLTMPEDGSLSVEVGDLLIDDPDDTSPEDFTLTLLPGENYSLNGNRIQPLPDFAGELLAPTIVNDGDADSEPFLLRLAVSPINDAPVISGQRELVTEEDAPITLRVTDLLIEDPDNAFPADFTLTLGEGESYTLTGTTVRPDADFNGRIDIPATVSDGAETSDPFLLRVEVRAVNDAPRLIDPLEDLQAVENEPFSIDFGERFEDPDGSIVSFELRGLPAGNALTLDPETGVLSGTPRFNDTRDFPFDVSIVATDEMGGTGSGDFQLTIAALDRANLGLEIAATPAPALLEDEARWTLTVRNAGPSAASELMVSGDFSGDGLTIAATGGADCVLRQADQTVTGFDCEVGTVPADGAATVAFLMSATSPGDVVVKGRAAVVGRVPIDPNASDNEAQQTLSITQRLSNGRVQALGNANVRAVAATDANGDGAFDLVLGTADGEPAELYFGEGTRTLSDVPALLPETAATAAIAVADLDGDGAEDLVFANAGGAPDSIYMNDGSGNFSRATGFGDDDSRGVVVEDLNGDGRADLAFAADGPNVIYLDNGAGAYVPVYELGEATSLDVASADLNGDGWPDLVFANSGADSTIFLNEAGNGFSSPVMLRVGNVAGVVADDLNGDGAPDLAFARQPDAYGDIPANPVLLNNGSGIFAPYAALGASPSTDVLVADFDADGFKDLFFINATGTHQVWRGKSDGYELDGEQIYEPGAVAGVSGDLGNDGGDDVALGANPAGGNLYLNDGFGRLGLGDAVPPVLSLLGASEIEVEAGAVFADPGASAIDNIDGDLSERVITTSTVDTRIVGSYKVVYSVSDRAGNAADPISRTVKVTPAEGVGGGGGGAVSPAWLALALWFCLAHRRRRLPPTESGSVSV